MSAPATLPPLKARALLLALLITGIWGVNFIVIKWSVAGAPPLLVAALRFALAALPAVLLYSSCRARRSPPGCCGATGCSWASCSSACCTSPSGWA